MEGPDGCPGRGKLGVKPKINQTLGGNRNNHNLTKTHHHSWQWQRSVTLTHRPLSSSSEKTGKFHSTNILPNNQASQTTLFHGMVKFPPTTWILSLSLQPFWYPARLSEGAGELDCQAWLQVVTANGKNLLWKAQGSYLELFKGSSRLLWLSLLETSFLEMLWSKFEVNEFLGKFVVGESIWVLVGAAEMFCLLEKSVLLFTAARSYHEGDVQNLVAIENCTSDLSTAQFCVWNQEISVALLHPSSKTNPTFYI